MPTYETIFIAIPGLTAEDESATVDAMSQVITDGEGSITAADRMGRRRLAYPIRKFDEGIYVRLLYDSGTEVPKELERRIRLSENVLRGLTVRLTDEWAEHAKEQAVRDAQRRVEVAAAEAAAAEAAAEAAAKAAAEPAEQQPPAEESVTTAVETPAGEAAVDEPVEAQEEASAEPDPEADSETEQS